MEEIKSSFRGVNKIIEEYNHKIYAVNFTESVCPQTSRIRQDSKLYSAVFYKLESAVKYLSDLFTERLNNINIERLDAEDLSYIDHFKKLFCTEGKFDISKINCKSHKSFDLSKMDFAKSGIEFNNNIYTMGINYLFSIKQVDIL